MVGAEPIALAPKAFDCLLLLAANAGRLVRKDDLMDALWPGQAVTEANLTNCIVGIRKALGADSIRTVSRHGYRLVLEVAGEPGISPDVYADFNRAKELIHERSPESLVKARDLLWTCVAANPEFAAFWAWLGRCGWLLDKAAARGPESSAAAEAAFRRAFLIEPGLSCAHQFYTPVELDSGRFRAAMARLRARPPEPETFAALVQVFRFAGLLGQSAGAHAKAVDLDPTIVTSVAHTHFLAGDYAAAIDGYSGRSGYYMDAAAWAALGQTERASGLLRERLSKQSLSPLMSGLMRSLLALLEGADERSRAIMRDTNADREPEALIYFARHYSRLGDAEAAAALIHRAAERGFRCAPETLQNHDWFAPLLATETGRSLDNQARRWRDEAFD